MPPTWSKAEARTAQNLSIPEKIKCDSCKKNLSQERFSRAQRAKYSEAIKNSRGKDIPPSKKPRCLGCTGQQVFELTCKYCGITKALDGFAKAQRHSPDNARCWDCVQSHLDELKHEDAVEVEENINSSDATSTYRSDILSGSFQNITLNGSVGSSAVFLDQCEDEDEHGVWVDQNEAYPVGHPASLASKTMTDRINPLTPSVVDSRNGKFAKIKAEPVPTQQLLNARLKREEKEKAARKGAENVDSSDDSSDDGLPY